MTGKILMLRKIFLWQEISDHGKKFISMARHFFPRKISVCDTTFTQENLFFLQESICLTGTFCFILKKKNFLSNLWRKCMNFCQHFMCCRRFPGSLAPWPWLTGNIPPCLLPSFLAIFLPCYLATLLSCYLAILLCCCTVNGNHYIFTFMTCRNRLFYIILPPA